MGLCFQVRGVHPLQRARGFLWGLSTLSVGRERKRWSGKKRQTQQERKRDKVIGTEYVLRPRQSEEREEVQPGRKPGIGKVK